MNRPNIYAEHATPRMMRVSSAILCIACALLAAVNARAASRPPRFDPAYADLSALRAALDERRINSEALVRYYLERIERFDHRGPHIDALITVNPHALEDARRKDAQARPERGRMPLYGIPFIVKDNIDSAGIATSAGSAVLAQSVPSANAVVVQKLLDAGAILLAKANLSELAESDGWLGYSSAGGLTLNPFNTSRNASGSSSGSAAAVAADFAPFALGTDTSGSLRGPASVNGLVSIRPTLGLISRSGVVPASLSFDTTGALTRTVRDQAIVLDVIAGPDPRDAATLTQPVREAAYVDGLRGYALDGVRLGVVVNFRGANSEVDRVERETLQRLCSRGAELIEIRLPPAFEELWSTVVGPVGEAEFRVQFERYLATRPPGAPRTLAELITRSVARADSERPTNPARLDSLRRANDTALTDSPEYIHLLTEVIPELRHALESVLEQNHVRALIFATMSCPASPRFDQPDPSYQCGVEDPYRSTYIASATGLPEITVPAGTDAVGVPIGMSMVGTPQGERQLLQLAEALKAGGAFVPTLPPR